MVWADLKIRNTRAPDVPTVVALQPLAFPPPFDPEMHWDPEHILCHVELFPEGQFVALADNQIIASCSNTLISEADWNAHGSWYQTVGGPGLKSFDRHGTTLYGLDIAVHPHFRRQGVARRLYEERFCLVRSLNLVRYGTACRIPDWRAWSKTGADQRDYAQGVAVDETTDRTLTPLLKMGLTIVDVIANYMPDPESGNAGVLLEWRP